MQLAGIFGVGGCGRGIMPLLRNQSAGQQCECVFVDDGNAAPKINGQRVMSLADFVADPRPKAIAIAIADPFIRRKIALRCEVLGVGFLAITGTPMVKMDDVEIGEGAILSPFVTITSNVRIGKHFHGNLYSYVEHDCVIGDYVTFAPSVRCNGNIDIGDLAYIGAGAIIKQGKNGAPLRIGAGAVIGMGAVVTRNVPAGATMVGNPARIMRG